MGFPLPSLTQTQNVLIVIPFFIAIDIAIDIAIFIAIVLLLPLLLLLLFYFLPVTLSFTEGWGEDKKKPRFVRNRVFKERRRHTLPQIAVPSAQAGLTSLFGMGRGEPRRNNHLKVVVT